MCSEKCGRYVCVCVYWSRCQRELLRFVCVISGILFVCYLFRTFDFVFLQLSSKRVYELSVGRAVHARVCVSALCIFLHSTRYKCDGVGGARFVQYKHTDTHVVYVSETNKQNDISR